MVKFFLLFSAISGALSVILGAFGAHGLKGKISEPLLAAYQTGTHYQMYHVLALMGLALLLLRLQTTPLILSTAGYLWVIGTILFSGSLYCLALGAPSSIGVITPIGGLLLIAGWICLSVGVIKLPL